MPRAPKYYRQTPVWISLLLSTLLHLTAIFLVRDYWLEEIAPRAFRARLARIPPRFKPRRLVVAKKKAELPQVEMEYLASRAEPQEVPEGELAVALPALPEVEEQLAPDELREIASGAKEDVPHLARERMLSPSELGLADSMGIASMDLLRIVDMARVDQEHALVMVDPSSRRDLLGYINFTRLRVYGGGGQGGALDALVRYLRDYTKLLARVRNESFDHFLSENLLKDPIHFIFEGSGLPAYRDEVLTYFSEEEKGRIGQYLRQGGFLLIEGSNRFLREMAGHLKSVLRDEGSLFVISPSHMIYHAFYDFGGGFPGEDKTRVVEGRENWGWYYPVNSPEPEAAEEPTLSVLSQFAEQEEEEERPRPLGLWGVELNGELVAVLSDLNLHGQWLGSFGSEEDDEGSLYSLMAGTNVVVYALTRPEGLTAKKARPVWMRSRPAAALGTGNPEGGRGAVDDGELFADLDASLALVQAPLGSRIEKRGLQVRLDGRYSLELLKRGFHGLLLHNLPAGKHWVELQYGGKRKQLEIDLQGGKVLTLTFGLNRFAFLSQLHMSQQDAQVGVDQWLESFSDLEVEEVYLGEDRVLLESSEEF